MPNNYLLTYSEQLATNIELLCQNVNVPSNPLFQIRKSSISIHANISEANYGHGRADMLSKFKIARKGCMETESWLKLMYSTNIINEVDYKTHRNLCDRIRRLLTSSCITIERK